MDDCAFVMPRFCPDKPSVKTAGSDISERSEKTQLSTFTEIAGIAIFFGTTFIMMLQANVLKSLEIWQICLAGAVCMIFSGTLKPKEAVEAIPLSMLLLIVGSLAMAAALSGTGAGDLIGGAIVRLQR